MNFENSSTIYISADGSDTASGFSPSEPIRSFERASRMISELERQPITIKLMGDYYIDEPIVLKNSCITIEPYGDRARIIGGRKIVGWQKDSLNGVDCYSVFIPAVKAGLWDFSDLYVNGRRASLCRFPKTELLRARSTELPDTTDLHTHVSWFVADTKDLESLRGVEGAIISFYHFWIDEHTPVKSYDKESGKITFKYRSRFALTSMYEQNQPSDMYYYVENIPCALTDSGEWYLDKASGMLYYIPLSSEDMASAEVFAPSTEGLIYVSGGEDEKLFGVRIRGIELICSRGDYESRTDLTDQNECGFASDVQAAFGLSGAVVFSHAEASSIENCRLSCLGQYAVEISDGCDGVRVENNIITDIGGGGVKIAGSNEREDFKNKCRHSIVRANTITHCGKRFAAACGVFIQHAAQNVIEKNEISYLDYTGISVGWIWGYVESETYGEIIRNNHIHHIGMGRLSDMGGIYLLGVQRGTVVSGNVIHDVVGANYGGWGIYTDEGSSFITVEKNVVYNCKSHCYHQNYGKNNSIRNNVFAFGGIAVVHMSRTNDHAGIFLEENTIISNGTPMYTFSETHDALPFVDLRSSSNIFYDTTAQEPILYKDGNRDCSLLEWQRRFGKDVGSRVEAPSGVKISNGRVDIAD